jgi:ppGpp synthetase/RelA/SpoT-type nucleotidyltranferase
MKLVVTGDLKIMDETEHTVSSPRPGKPGELLTRGYRSIHLTVKLGERRLQFLETKGLDDVWCEIQLRSILAHGWAEIAHEHLYKSGIPTLAFDDSAQGLRMQELMIRAALALQDQDETFAEVREIYEKLLARYCGNDQ